MTWSLFLFLLGRWVVYFATYICLFIFISELNMTKQLSILQLNNLNIRMLFAHHRWFSMEFLSLFIPEMDLDAFDRMFSEFFLMSTFVKEIRNIVRRCMTAVYDPSLHILCICPFLILLHWKSNTRLHHCIWSMYYLPLDNFNNEYLLDFNYEDLTERLICKT
jgi:hypothetical protein